MGADTSKYLITVATPQEIAPLAESFFADFTPPVQGMLKTSDDGLFDVLVTGPGIAATVYFTTRTLLETRYRLALNVGIAGSFRPVHAPGTLVHMMRDRFADMGSESFSGFIPGEKLPFTLHDRPPYKDGWLTPETSAKGCPGNLPRTSGITSDTVHTIPDTVERLKDLFDPDVESMEGAAFFYACILTGIPCLQIRAVSNMVGPRNDAGWQTGHAIRNLNQYLISHIHDF